jgi:hypothetical protein
MFLSISPTKISWLAPWLTILTFLLLGYNFCTGGIHCDNSEQSYIIPWLDHPNHLPLPLQKTLTTTLEAGARSFMVLFQICIRTHQSYTFTFISSIHSSPSQVFTNLHTIRILQSYLPLWISRLMFKGFSQSFPGVNLLSFGQFNPFQYSSSFSKKKKKLYTPKLILIK